MAVLQGLSLLKDVFSLQACVSNHADSNLRFLKLSACGLLFVALVFLRTLSTAAQITILVITEDGTHLKHRRPRQQTHQKLALLES